jgi:hypothetical protein
MSRHVAIADDKPTEIQHEKLAGGDDNALTETGTRGTSVDGSNYPDSATGLTHKEELKKAERKLLIKQGECFWRSTHDLLHECLKTARADAPDAVILPFALLLYLSAYLDRGNMLVVSTLDSPLKEHAADCQGQRPSARAPRGSSRRKRQQLLHCSFVLLHHLHCLLRELPISRTWHSYRPLD